MCIAACKGKLEVVKALVRHEVDVNARQPTSGSPALRFAVENNHAKVVDVLIEAGANVAPRMKHGFTPLHVSAQQGGCDAMLALLRRGEEVDTPDNGGQRPLTIACRHVQERIANLLLR